MIMETGSELHKRGGAAGNRTPDLFDANEARYQLRYSPWSRWWPRADSNNSSGSTLNPPPARRHPRQTWAGQLTRPEGLPGKNRHPAR
jgi:hypothetical protein